MQKFLGTGMQVMHVSGQDLTQKTVSKLDSYIHWRNMLLSSSFEQAII